MLLTNHEETALLIIAGSVDIANGEELRDALRDHVARYPAPALDLSTVQTCDASVLQLLWSASLTAARAHKTLRVTAWSEAVRQTVAALGLPFQELEGASVRGL